VREVETVRYFKIPKGEYSLDEVKAFFKQFCQEGNVTIEGTRG